MRQRTLGESFGLASEPAACVAYRNAFTGLEYLHRARDLAERGMNLELRAYQTNVFLDWRDLRDRPDCPWGALCDRLAGRGVPSLEDALRDLQLTPVHDALRALVDPALAETLAGCAAMKEDPERTECASSAIETFGKRAVVLLAEIERYAASGAGKAAGIAAENERHGNESVTQHSLARRLEEALRLPALYRRAHARWPTDANTVLPIDNGVSPQTVSVWRTVLAWCVLEAAGRRHGPSDPDAAAARLFDALRLRAPLAESFAGRRAPEDEHWRAAARLRASFALAARSAPYNWVHDPDVAWLIGVHPHEGANYLVKEHFERLLWWMILPDLLKAAGEENPDLGRFDLVKDEIDERMEAVAKGGYKVETLEGFEPLDKLQEREEKLR
jgi:hypothetical protein